VIPRQRDGYLMLDDLHRRYCTDPGQNYFGEWCRAVKDYSTKRKQSLIDLVVDAANLAHTIRDDASRLNDPLVAAAIRDTNPTFDFSNPPTGQALEGAVNAAKGKYFEYLVVDRLNNGERVGDVVLPDGFTAKVAESMTQPGWDIQILDHNSRVADYLQLKATDNAGYIREALDRYPEDDQHQLESLYSQRRELRGRIDAAKEFEVAADIADDGDAYSAKLVDPKNPNELTRLGGQVVMGKLCARCQRPMAIRWPTSDPVIADLFWGCSSSKIRTIFQAVNMPRIFRSRT
jgi:hypothetical protein